MTKKQKATKNGAPSPNAQSKQQNNLLLKCSSSMKITTPVLWPSAVHLGQFI
jgi:hypothetical protein